MSRHNSIAEMLMYFSLKQVIEETECTCKDRWHVCPRCHAEFAVDLYDERLDDNHPAGVEWLQSQGFEKDDGESVNDSSAPSYSRPDGFTVFVDEGRVNLYWLGQWLLADPTRRQVRLLLGVGFKKPAS